MTGYFLLLCIVCVTLFGIVTKASVSSSNDIVKTWLTVADPTTAAAIHILQPGEISANIAYNYTPSLSVLEVNLDVHQRLQSMVGFGAGLPQSSAHVLLQLKSSQPQLYQQVLEELFSTTTGAGFNILRFPIGSCDFSLRNTSYDEVKKDYSLQYFAIDTDSEKIVEVLQDVRKINPALQVIASPWSAPSWMKVMDSLIAYNERNTLINDDQIYDTYANYLVKVTQAFALRGVSIDYMTLQNEPLFGNGDEYPGMYLDATSANRLGSLVHKKLQDQKIATKLLAYDHNWDHPEYPLANLKGSSKIQELTDKDTDNPARNTSSGILQSESNPFYGVAWHCYGGDMTTALSQVQDQYPYLPQFITECTGGYPDGVCDITQGLTSFGWNHEWDMRNILLGAVGQFAQASVKWILALDEDCGPVLPDVSFRNGRPLVSIPSTTQQSSDIQWNQDFWSIRHLSQFLPPSSLRVEHQILSSGSATVAANSNDSNIKEGEQFLIEGFVTPNTRILTIIVMNLQHDVALPLRCTIVASAIYNDDNGTDGLGRDVLVAKIEDELPPFATKVYQFPYQPSQK